MKKRTLIVMLGMTLALSAAITGCGTGGNEAAQSSSEAVSEDASESDSSSDSGSQDSDGQLPEKPDGAAPEDGSQPPEMPDGEGGPDGQGGPGGPGGQGGPGGPGGGQSQSDISYSSDNEISTDTALSGKTIDSTGTDEEAILVDSKATASLSGLTVSRTSDDSTGGDNSSFYGIGAALLTTDGTTYLSGSTITTDAKGGAGVFSYGENSTTYVADTTISTSQDTSGGIHVAGGGTLYAYDDKVTTAGGSSAAIRSDRGGGTMVVEGGSYTSNGTGSPAVYSTADITIHDADLTANGSEAVCIEGLNSIRLFDCDLTGDMPDSEQNDCTWNVILYQSMSGDSEIGNSTFEMQGGTLTAKNGGMFYTTNTESTFILNDVDITYADENDFFLKCTGNSNARGWGSEGSNGADCSFTAIDQDMEGNIIWDSISQLDFYMVGSSTLKGAVVDDESGAGNGGDGYCSLTIGSGSTWIVTGDSTLTNLYNAGTIQDASGRTVTIKGTDGTVYVKGTGSCTVTVSSYSTEADLSGASSLNSWSSYEVARPSELS